MLQINILNYIIFRWNVGNESETSITWGDNIDDVEVEDEDEDDGEGDDNKDCELNWLKWTGWINVGRLCTCCGW